MARETQFLLFRPGEWRFQCGWREFPVDRWHICDGVRRTNGTWVLLPPICIIRLFKSNSFFFLTICRTRTIYFHALASTKEFSVPNYVLQNETRALSSESYYDYALVGDRGPNGQSTAEQMDGKTKVLIYTQVNKDGIGCWNSSKPYTQDTQGIIDSDSDALVFPNDLKIDRSGSVWVLSDRLPLFIYKKLNPNEFNYRILSGKVADLILGTPCEWLQFSKSFKLHIDTSIIAHLTILTFNMVISTFFMQILTFCNLIRFQGLTTNKNSNGVLNRKKNSA